MKPDLCPSCGALPCDWTNTPADWQPIETMPSGKWVFVFVPGAGPGFCAIKKPPHGFWGGRIIGLESGKHITRATHWRPVFLPPERWQPSMVSDNNLYESQSA